MAAAGCDMTCITTFHKDPPVGSKLRDRRVMTTAEESLQLQNRVVIVHPQSWILYTEDCPSNIRFCVPQPNTASSKSRVNHYWHMLYLSKNKLHWNLGRMRIIRWKCSSRSRMQAFTLFLVFDAARRTVLCRGKGSPDQTLWVWHRRIGKCVPKHVLISKNEMPGNVREQAVVACRYLSLMVLLCCYTSFILITKFPLTSC
jgi:hypothetical protein